MDSVNLSPDVKNKQGPIVLSYTQKYIVKIICIRLTVNSMIQPPTNYNPFYVHSTYWIPTLITPNLVTFYYHNFANFSTIQLMSLGLIMVTKSEVGSKFSCECGEPSNSI